MKQINLAPLFLMIALCLPAAGAGKNPAPAKVEGPVQERDLGNITLTADAEKRLGIVTTPAVRRKVERTRLFGGEIVLPARGGNSSAAVAAGQNVFAVPPLSTPADVLRLAESQIDADGQVEQARVQLEAAKVALVRAEQLLRDKAGSGRAADEARAQVSTAEAGLRTAQARRELLGPAVMDAANQPMLWVRVPVYVGDLPKLNTTDGASVGGLADLPGVATFPAKPVSAPPSANAAAATVDLFYEINNTNGVFRLGQRVGATLPLRGDEESLVILWPAIVHDVQGGAWAYEKTGPLTYIRRRVQVARVVGQQAVLASGLKPGAQIVTTGAAELFGTEFGLGK